MNNNYLNYYNVFDEFDAGAGIKEKELFTEEQQLSFLPKKGIGNGGFDGVERLYSNIINNNDIKSLLALIMLVFAINTNSLVALIFIILSAIFVPVPALIIAYCIALHLKNGSDATHVGISILLMLASAVTIYLTSTSKISKGFKRAIDVVLLVILGFYIVKIYGIDREISMPSRRYCRQMSGPSSLENLNAFQTHSNY
ncbi:phosphorylated virion membrane protein [Penguinpox virus]|uniref:Phosphorylated virion membrane protein n=1 Tax=Penguinpox virus TaxID=648998 RepID=A0A068EFH8_9POXV|nr:phosphorylated virion membrane protein [Penguinpox virus]AID46921.1 phosphorylated virion membrane protein [Penguinpox virus]